MESLLKQNPAGTESMNTLGLAFFSGLSFEEEIHRAVKADAKVGHLKWTRLVLAHDFLLSLC